MMNFLIVACVLAIAAKASNLKEDGENFQTFKLTHGKIYRNQAEETQRFAIFKENLRSIERHNALYEQGLVSYKEGITKFADMTEEEFKAFLTLSSAHKPEFNSTEYVKTGLTIPDSVDWRTKGQVTEVKDQGHCGSCWAFSITGSTEAAFYRKSGKLVTLSEQQLVDCSTKINSGCNGGGVSMTFPYVQEYGLEAEDSYPYTATDGPCKYSSSNVVANVSDYKLVNFNDENALLDAVANVGPVSAGMNAYYLASYKSGIYKDKRCAGLLLNHAVLVVGYGSEKGKDFWIVKNSWGKDWGDGGYFRLARGNNECGIAVNCAYPTCN